ncbi:hypothetical protein Tco_0871934 [Tanacetum coccineum]
MASQFLATPSEPTRDDVKKFVMASERLTNIVLKGRATVRLLFEAMRGLTPQRKRVVKEMGFGNLIDFPIVEIPTKLAFYVRKPPLDGFPAQSVGSSNAIALDSPYLLVLITRASQSRQHEDGADCHLFNINDLGMRKLIATC